MDNFENFETQAEETQVYTEEPQAVYSEPSYTEPAPTYNPAPQPQYNYVPQQYNSYEPDTDEGGLDGKSIVLGTIIGGGIAAVGIAVKKGIDFAKKKKAEKEEFKKWQDERKAAEDTIAKAKAEGKVVDVDAKPVEEAKAEEVKTQEEPAAQPEAKNEKKNK